MSFLSRDKMPTMLKLLNVVLLAAALLFFIILLSGVASLFGARMDSVLLPFVMSGLIAALLSIVALLAFVRIIRSVVISKEFFSGAQSRRMLTIAVCMLLRVAADLFTPAIEIPSAFDGAIGPMSLGPSLDLMTLAVSLMFFALAGVFEYGRKLQEDSDNIL